MKWLFVIDPIEDLNYETDSTYAIMKEAFRQGIEVYFCRMQDIFFKDALKCISNSCSFISDNYKVDSSNIVFLDSFDIVFMRKDPPYDMIFHYCTELLSLAGTLVVNSPQALRDFNEKLIILPFTEYIPETMVTSDESQIKTFLRNHPTGLILKSLSSYQGRSVYWIKKKNENSDEILRSYTQNFTEPVMIQEYIPDVRVGDKRILVLGGKIIGAVLREPLENNYLANLGQGGIARKTSITEREYEIVTRISDFLLNNGLFFVGLDVIGDYLTEINITCPTGIVHINKLNNTLLEKEIVQYFSHLASNLD
ncbi:MAG: glutathione synthase [Promethearchaeota archaeon]|jgi:glutathione synthase